MHYPDKKKTIVDSIVFFSYIRLIASFIATQLYFCFAKVIFSFAELTGEYNITEPAGFQYHF